MFVGARHELHISFHLLITFSFTQVTILLLQNINQEFCDYSNSYLHFGFHKISFAKVNAPGKLNRLSQWRTLPEFQVAMLIKKVNQSIGNHDNGFDHFGVHNASTV